MHTASPDQAPTATAVSRASSIVATTKAVPTSANAHSPPPTLNTTLERLSRRSVTRTDGRMRVEASFKKRALKIRISSTCRTYHPRFQFRSRFNRIVSVASELYLEFTCCVDYLFRFMFVSSRLLHSETECSFSEGEHVTLCPIPFFFSVTLVRLSPRQPLFSFIALSFLYHLSHQSQSQSLLRFLLFSYSYSPCPSLLSCCA